MIIPTKKSTAPLFDFLSGVAAAYAAYQLRNYLILQAANMATAKAVAAGKVTKPSPLSIEVAYTGNSIH
jgi:hypothetical protein